MDYLSLDLEATKLEVSAKCEKPMLELEIQALILQALKSLPWEKVDIKVISLAVERGKHDDRLENTQVDQRDDLVNKEHIY